MQIRETRRLRLPHIISFNQTGGGLGKLEASDLAEMMARWGQQKEFQPIQELIRNIKLVEADAKKAGYPDYWERSKAGLKYEKDVWKALLSLNDFFSKRKYAVSLGDVFRDGWEQVLLLPPKFRNDAEMNSHMLGWTVWSVAVDGQMWRVRECQQCGAWFYARRKVHTFCSGKCREKAFRGSGEGKAKRAKFMREYRARLRRRDAANLRASRNKKG